MTCLISEIFLWLKLMEDLCPCLMYTLSCSFSTICLCKCPTHQIAFSNPLRRLAWKKLGNEREQQLHPSHPHNTFISILTTLTTTSPTFYSDFCGWKHQKGHPLTHKLPKQVMPTRKEKFPIYRSTLCPIRTTCFMYFIDSFMNSNSSFHLILVFWMSSFSLQTRNFPIWFDEKMACFKDPICPNTFTHENWISRKKSRLSDG